MNRHIPRALRQSALAAALALGLNMPGAQARASDVIYSGAECSLSSVASSLQDRHFGKLKSNAAGTQTVVCPVPRPNGEPRIELVEVDIVGATGSAQCRLYRRAPSGARYSNNVNLIQLANINIEPGGLWRHVFFPGAQSFVVGGGQSVAIQCLLETGQSILRYRAVTE